MIKDVVVVLILMSAVSVAWWSMQSEGHVEKVRMAEDAVLKTIQDKHPDMQIDRVRESKIKGLYEAFSGSSFAFFDATGTYVILGQMIDAENRVNVSEESVKVVRKEILGELSVNDAIESGDPHGKTLIVFTDPECPFCKKLEGELDKVEGIKVLTYFYPLERIHPDAKRKADAIWCAENQAQALKDVVKNGKSIVKDEGSKCEAPLQKMKIVAERLGVKSTPTLLMMDGSKMDGALSAEQLSQWMNLSGKGDKQ